MSSPRSGLLARLRGARDRAGPATPSDPDSAPDTSEPCVWLHASDAENARALRSVSERLSFLRPDLRFVQTGHGPHSAVAKTVETSLSAPQEAAQFVRDWAPDLGVIAGQVLPVNPIMECAEAGCDLTLLNIRDAPIATPTPRWVGDRTARCLSRFARVFVANEGAQRRLRRLGVAQQALHVGGMLQEAGQPPPARDDLVDEVLGYLGGRPVWLAACLRGEEASPVLEAHRQATRLSHRLILLLIPASAEDATLIQEIVTSSEMRVCDWDAGEIPDDNTQILLAGDASELGLWYRAAPLAFLGGSLISGVGGTPPLDAAALGTGILYGPNVGNHLAAYSRLAEAGGARIVGDADSLGQAVGHLIAPDRSAAMAHAGWDVATASAELTDTLCETLLSVLDDRETL